MKFGEDSDRAMEGFDLQSCMRFTREVIIPRGLVFNRLVHTKGLKAEFGFESRRGKLQVSSMFACH